MNRDLMSQLSQMQDRLAKAQAEVESQIAEGTAGGGAVSVSISGTLRVQAMKIDPEVVDPSDVAMLEDLVSAAVNEALQKYQELQAQKLSGLTGGLGLPGLGGPAPGASAAPSPPLNRAARRKK